MKRNQGPLWIIVCVTVCLFLLPRALSAAEETGWAGLEVMQLYDYATKDSDKRGSIVAVNVLSGSPADQQGIKKGDIILEIDHMPTRRRDFGNVLKTLGGGDAKNEINLLVWRPHNHEQFEIRIRRAQTAR